MSKPIRPYVSVDLETTGVNTEKVHILEIGAVFDDGVTPIDQLDTFETLVKEPFRTYTEDYAMWLNHEILGEIAKTKPGEDLSPEGTDVAGMYGAISGLRRFIQKAAEKAYEWDKENKVARPSRSVSFAGKNVSGFDWPIIMTNIDRLYDCPVGSTKGIQSLKDFFTPGTRSENKDATSCLKRRVIDPGSMFYPEFGYVPSLDEINELTQQRPVNHRAVDDAMQVVVAIRKGVGL